MAYISEQTIAANGSQALTVPTLAGGAIADAKSCVLEVRASGGGGVFSYRMSGSAASAGTFHSLVVGQQLTLCEGDMTTFRIIRDTDGQGTIYVTYDDKVPDRSNRRWKE